MSSCSWGLRIETTVCIVRVSPITFLAFVTFPRIASRAAGVNVHRWLSEASRMAPASATSLAPAKPSALTMLTQAGRRNAMIPSSILGCRVMYSARTPVENATRLRCTATAVVVVPLSSSASDRRETTKRAKSDFRIISPTIIVRGSGVEDSLYGYRNAHIDDGLVGGVSVRLVKTQVVKCTYLIDKIETILANTVES